MTLRSTPLRLALLLVASVLALVGCTGGGDTSLPPGTGAGINSNTVVVSMNYVNPRGEVARVITGATIYRVQILNPGTLADVVPPVEVPVEHGDVAQNINVYNVPLGNWIVRVTGLSPGGLVMGVSPDMPVTVGSEQAASATVTTFTSYLTNGSFETGSYDAWTIAWQEENPPITITAAPAKGYGAFAGQVGAQQEPDPYQPTMGIATNGQVLQADDQVLDFFTQTQHIVTSINLPISYTATDGTYCQFMAQNGPSSYRMYQTVTVPAGTPRLAWDMRYYNAAGSFTPDQQEIKVLVRDAETDAVLATMFQTVDGVNPPTVPTMTTFAIDLSAWSGQAIRVDFTQINLNFYFDVITDNWRWGAIP